MRMIDLEHRAGDAAELLGAIGNPKRVLLLCHLLDEELSVGELSERVGLAQSPLSQHLAKLRALRLVMTRRDGQMIRYRLTSEDVARVLATLHGIYCAQFGYETVPHLRERIAMRRRDRGAPVWVKVRFGQQNRTRHILRRPPRERTKLWSFFTSSF